MQHDAAVARLRQRRDSGGRDSGIEPSPRVSRIPRRTNRCCPNSERQRALHMDTITRDVQISMRRYHLERKIFFQLMELKRLQIRHGRANEPVLVKRQVRFFVEYSDECARVREIFVERLREREILFDRDGNEIRFALVEGYE